LGGFLPRFPFVLDWEMWQRIAAHYLFWFEPALLASYRVHPSSMTSRLALEAADVRDIHALIEYAMRYHTPQRASALAGEARRYYAERAILNARRLLVAGHSRAAWKQIAEALRHSRGGLMLWQVALFLILHMRILGSRLKRALR
jgi:hypothetical protein